MWSRCIAFGTPSPSSPSVVRTRTRKFRPLRSSSIEAILTGAVSSSTCRTGASAARTSCSSVTRRSSAAAARRDDDVADAASTPAPRVLRRNDRRARFMVGFLPGRQCQMRKRDRRARSVRRSRTPLALWCDTRSGRAFREARSPANERSRDPDPTPSNARTTPRHVNSRPARRPRGAIPHQHMS